MLRIWLTGYLTATNSLTFDTYDITAGLDVQECLTWLVTYCLLNPLENVTQAVGALRNTLYPTRVRQAPAVIVPPAPAAPLARAPRVPVPQNTWNISTPPSTLPGSPVVTPVQSAPRRELIRHVQGRRQAAGFSAVATDGALGPQTRDALRWFQNAKGIRATGELDEATLDALGVR